MKGKKKQVSTKNTPQPEGVSSGFSGDERAANAHPRDERASESEIGYQVVEARVARIEASFQQMASVMGAMKSTLDKIEAGGHSSRKRQRSPPRSSSRHTSGSSSSDGSDDSYSRHPSRRHRGKPKPFDQERFIDRHSNIDSFEALVLVNIRTIKIMYEQGDDLMGLIQHIELLCEKSLTHVYKASTLIEYDRSVRERANKKGCQAYDTVENSDVLRHFSYDGTIVSERGKVKVASKPKYDANVKKNCFAFNKNEGGCSLPACKYAHKCIYCQSPSHGASGCGAGAKVNK